MTNDALHGMHPRCPSEAEAEQANREGDRLGRGACVRVAVGGHPGGPEARGIGRTAARGRPDGQSRRDKARRSRRFRRRRRDDGQGRRVHDSRGCDHRRLGTTTAGRVTEDEGRLVLVDEAASVQRHTFRAMGTTVGVVTTLGCESRDGRSDPRRRVDVPGVRGAVQQVPRGERALGGEQAVRVVDAGIGRVLVDVAERLSTEPVGPTDSSIRPSCPRSSPPGTTVISTRSSPGARRAPNRGAVRSLGGRRARREHGPPTAGRGARLRGIAKGWTVDVAAELVSKRCRGCSWRREAICVSRARSMSRVWRSPSRIRTIPPRSCCDSGSSTDRSRRHR